MDVLATGLERGVDQVPSMQHPNPKHELLEPRCLTAAPRAFCHVDGQPEGKTFVVLGGVCAKGGDPMVDDSNNKHKHRVLGASLLNSMKRRPPNYAALLIIPPRSHPCSVSPAEAISRMPFPTHPRRVASLNASGTAAAQTADQIGPATVDSCHEADALCEAGQCPSARAEPGCPSSTRLRNDSVLPAGWQRLVLERRLTCPGPAWPPGEAPPHGDGPTVQVAYP